MAIQNLGLRTPQTIEPSETARTAAQRMEKNGIGCLVVVSGKKPVGIVTDRDLALHILAGKRDAGLVRIGEVAARSPVTVTEGASVAEVARTMRKHGVRRLPVVDEQGELVGVAVLDDLLRLVASEIGDLAEALRRQLSGETHHEAPTALA